MKISKVVLINLLLLIAIIAIASFGWVTGHILRHSMFRWQHPPIRQPGEEIGKVHECFIRQLQWEGPISSWEENLATYYLPKSVQLDNH